MSTVLHDVESNVLLESAVYPGVIASTEISEAIDLLDADGSCFAIQVVGTVSGTDPSLTGKIQESNDASVWNDIPGAVFSTVTGDLSVQVITFQRNQRYLRYVATISGTSTSFNVATMIGSERKMV